MREQGSNKKKMLNGDNNYSVPCAKKIYLQYKNVSNVFSCVEKRISIAKTGLK